METKTYASYEERAADLLYHRIGKLKLIKDKAGKPIKYVQEFPSIEQLINICRKEEIKLPKATEIKDILLAMVHAAYTAPQRHASPDLAIKSLEDRVIEKAYKDAGVDVEDKSKPVGEKEAEVNKKEAEDAKVDPEQFIMEVGKQVKIEVDRFSLEYEKNAAKAAEQAKKEFEHVMLEAEQARRETQQAKLETEQVKLEAEHVELLVERTELEVDPDKNKAKLQKNANELITNETAQSNREDRMIELVNYEAALKKKDKLDKEAAKKATISKSP